MLSILRKIVLVIAVWAILGEPFLKAQDAQFSQYYAAPVYHNPAFAGTFSPQRLTLNYRNQWPGLPAPIQTTALTFDAAIKKTNSGWGIMYTNDRAGVAALTSNSINGIFSQKMRIGANLYGALGGQIGYTLRDLDLTGLLFPDQVTPGGIVTNTLEPRRDTRVGFFNVGLGVLLYGKEYWAGASLHNLNQPSIAPLANQGSVLPTRMTFVSGLRIELEDERFLRGKRLPYAVLPSVMVRNQAGFWQLDGGVSMELDPLILGLYLRGLPIAGENLGLFTQDALIFQLGMIVGDLRIGYSYDYNLGLQFANFQGAHEIAIQYAFNLKQIIKDLRYPCPGF